VRKPGRRDENRGACRMELLSIDRDYQLLVSCESQDNSALKPERVSIVEVPDRPSIIGAEANLEFRRRPIIDAAAGLKSKTDIGCTHILKQPSRFCHDHLYRHCVADAKRFANFCRCNAGIDTEMVKVSDPLWCLCPRRPLHAPKLAEAFFERDDVDAGS
jgi:hypothetical protein